VSPTILALGGFILGAIVGSFLATLCLRWPEGRSIVTGRSACDGCGKPLGAGDLVPLLSAARARGGARCCGQPIDPLHGRVEWVAALLGAAALGTGGWPQGAALALFAWLLLPLALLDARHFWLPDRLILLLAGAGLGLGQLTSGEDLVTRLLTALAAGAGLALVGVGYRAVRKREGLGSGDPKMLAALGLWLGPELTLAALLLAALLGLAEALVRRRRMDSAMPFGTLLALAAWPVALAATATA
jgi:leader peptidase (prepilin peptidase)/N-methyltransferase